jgi:hypothetical protein
MHELALNLNGIHNEDPPATAAPPFSQLPSTQIRMRVMRLAGETIS